MTAGGQEFRVRKSGTGATMTVVEDGEVIVRTYYADRAAAERAAAVSAANAERRLRAAARSAVTA